MPFHIIHNTSCVNTDRQLNIVMHAHIPICGVHMYGIIPITNIIFCIADISFRIVLCK